MCDLFQANPWKPLLCTNCHQNRSGHPNLAVKESQCEHIFSSTTTNLPASTSSMHLYEEIMAQYFTINPTDLSTSVVECSPSPTINETTDHINNNEVEEEDSFSDEEQDLTKVSAIEFIPNQSMINTQGIVLIGPDLRVKEMTTKKSKKIQLLRKSKSNAGECLKKTEMIENNTSKSWWFKVKKANVSPIVPAELTEEMTKSIISSPTLNGTTPQQKIRVLPEVNKLTLNEALNIARRQHSSSQQNPKFTIINKPSPSPTVSTGQSNYGSSIASTTSSSTQSSHEYDSHTLPNPVQEESTYLTAISPIEQSLSLATMLDRTNKCTIERLTVDLRVVIDEYKHNLPVARFQTLKSFLHQHHSSKVLPNETIYLLLFQILDEYAHQTITIPTFDHFLIAFHSTTPIIVLTAPSCATSEELSVEQFIQNLVKNLFDPSSMPVFNDLATLQNVSYRYLCNQILQFTSADMESSVSMQRVKLVDSFWHQIPSLRHLQINEENERVILALYHLMRYISQSDHIL